MQRVLASVFKGLNVFPGRLRGDPMGAWDGTVPPLEIRTYKYDALFVNERLFVARELSQLPTIAPVPNNVVFNNTVNLIQLRERFALNGWVLSRPVMFAAATCLRSTIIEDLGCHWYPKNLGLLPMPAEITEALAEEVRRATETLVEKDDNLADRWRHVELLLAGAASQSINQLIAAGSPLVEGLVLPIHEIDDTLPDEIEITDIGLSGDQGVFEMLIPNADLRAVLWYRSTASAWRMGLTYRSRSLATAKCRRTLVRRPQRFARPTSRVPPQSSRPRVRRLTRSLQERWGFRMRNWPTSASVSRATRSCHRFARCGPTVDCMCRAIRTIQAATALPTDAVVHVDRS
jgi:hypothetical protein